MSQFCLPLSSLLSIQLIWSTTVGCATCGYGTELGKVTFTIPQITYGETEKEVTWTRTIPDNYVVMLQADSGIELSYRHDCLSAGLADLFGGTEMTAGEHTLNVSLLINDVPPTFELPFTVKRVTLTGAPTYTAISAGGKTLTAPEDWPEGDLSWNLPEDTVVTANTRYEWTFTPADTTNYERLGGVIILWVQSTGGGGGTVTLTVTPDSGYELDTLTVTDSRRDAVLHRHGQGQRLRVGGPAVGRGERYHGRQGGGILDPKGLATRAQAAQMLKNFFDK